MEPLLKLQGKAVQLSLLLIVFIVPLVFCTRLEDSFELPQTLVALVAAVFLALFLSKGNERGMRDPIQSLYWLFLAAGALSFLRLVLGSSFYFSTQNYLWLLTAFLFLVPLGSSVTKRKLMAFAVLAGVLGALYSLAQVLGLDLAGWSTHFGGRSFSTFGNPIFWAGHLLVLLPLALYLVLSSPKKRERFFWAGALVLLFLGLLASQTRGAWLGALGEMGLLVYLNRRRGIVWKGSMGAIIVFLLALLAIPSLQERALSILHFHGQDAQGRYFMWDAALRLWDQKKILGQGPGGYAAHFHRVQGDFSQQAPFHPYWTAFHAHNDYLEILAERGLLGFLLGGLVVVLLLKRRIQTEVATSLTSAYSADMFRAGGQPPVGQPSVKAETALANDSHEGISANATEIVIMVGIGIQSLFNFPLSVVPTACLLALLFNPSWDDRRAEPKGEAFKVPSNLRVLLGLGMVLICAFGMEVFAQNKRLHQAIDQIGVQQYEEALRSLNFEPVVHPFHYLDPRVLGERAEALDALGRTSEAAQALEESTAAYPEDADAHAILCMLYGKQKKWTESESEGAKALQLSPCHEKALTNLAMASYLQGHSGDAVQYLSRLEQAEGIWGQAQKASEIQQKISALQQTRR